MKDIVYIRLFANPLLGEIRINGNITTEYRGYLNDVVSIEAIALGGKSLSVGVLMTIYQGKCLICLKDFLILNLLMI